MTVGMGLTEDVILMVMIELLLYVYVFQSSRRYKEREVMEW